MTDTEILDILDKQPAWSLTQGYQNDEPYTRISVPSGVVTDTSLRNCVIRLEARDYDPEEGARWDDEQDYGKGRTN